MLDKPETRVLGLRGLFVEARRRGDMAAARVLHSVGLYAESETVLQRVGNYLL